jgi:hypothetical protein
MTLLRNRTPVQLLWIIAASNLLVAIGFGTLALPRRFYHVWHPLLLCSFIIVILGFIGSLIAEQEFKEGIASERWTDTLLNGPRKLHSAFLVLAGLFIVASIIIAISSARHFAGAWVFLWPAMCLTRLSNYLRPKPTSSNGSLLKSIEPPEPLDSEHWGTPPRPFSN